MAKDYIPARDADFDVWYQNIVSYVGNKVNKPPVEWTHIPTEAALAFFNGYTDWHAAYTVTLYPHVPADIVAKNEERKKSEGIIRPFVKQYLRFPPVTDADRENMGVPNYASTRTPVPKPATVPEAEVKMPHPTVIEIHFHDEGSKSHAKPDGVRGAKIAYALFDTPPATVEELPRSDFNTSSPFTLNFGQNERGRTLYFALRWENTTAKKGTWSLIQSTIVP